MSSASQSFRQGVGVVGAGRTGIALAHRIAETGRKVYLLTSIPRRAQVLEKERVVKSVLPELPELHSNVRVTVDPAQLADRCTHVFLTVSDAYFRRLLDPLGEHLDGAHRIVHAVHSLHGRKLRRTSQMIHQVTSVRQIGVLAGPLHVGEMLRGRPNSAVIASEFPALIDETRDVLDGTNLAITGNADFHGVELAASLHQIVTLAIGIADGLELGSAAHATLASAGLEEIAMLGERLGASYRTFYGVAGMGRLVDALNRGDSNYELGRSIGSSESVAEALAGAAPEAKSPEVVRHLSSWADENGVSLPFTRALNTIFNGESRPEDGLRLMLREPGYAAAE